MDSDCRLFLPSVCDGSSHCSVVGHAGLAQMVTFREAVGSMAVPPRRSVGSRVRHFLPSTVTPPSPNPYVSSFQYRQFDVSSGHSPRSMLSKSTAHQGSRCCILMRPGLTNVLFLAAAILCLFWWRLVWCYQCTLQHGVFHGIALWFVPMGSGVSFRIIEIFCRFSNVKPFQPFFELACKTFCGPLGSSRLPPRQQAGKV